MSLLRVAMIIQAYLPHVGGAERQIASLAPLLQKEGCEIRVITRRFSGLSRKEVLDNVEVHRLPVPGPKALASASFTISALPVLRKFRPHILHAHELLSPVTTALAAKRVLGTPVIAKVLRGGMLGDIAKLQNRFLGQRRIEAIRDSVDAFAVISKEIDQELASVGISQKKRRFIPNGVDTQRFSPAAPELREELRQSYQLGRGPVVVYCGRLVPEKRVGQLIDIWPSVRQEHKDAVLLILGEGEEEQSLARVAVEGVDFRGRVQDVTPYLQSADLFVLPSATEGLSNALLEAASCALPTVATRVGGTPDVITDAENGLLVPANNPKLLQNAIITLLSNPTRSAMMGMLSRQRVIRNFSLASTATKLTALYREMIYASAEPAAHAAIGA